MIFKVPSQSFYVIKSESGIRWEAFGAGKFRWPQSCSYSSNWRLLALSKSGSGRHAIRTHSRSHDAPTSWSDTEGPALQPLDYIL